MAANIRAARWMGPIRALMTATTISRDRTSAWTILQVFLRLGLSSFGGPIAHLGYFRQEFVTRRRWLSEHAYADLVAVCQFLPGPSSSQVGIGIGLLRAGLPGGLAAWLGFTLPSALLMWGFAFVLHDPDMSVPLGIGHGLKLVAVAVVAQAVWGMAKSFCTDSLRIGIAMVFALWVLLEPGAWVQLGGIIIAGVIGLVLLRGAPTAGARGGDEDAVHSTLGHRMALAALGGFFALLVGLPALAQALDSPVLRVAAAFDRVSSLVFGGGHVVLPLLQTAIVRPGWVSQAHFLAGYGAAQALPGPLFSFAAFLGAVMQRPPQGWVGATVALVAIFLPAFLLVVAVLPYWQRLRHSTYARGALAGLNAAVVGLLLAALYDPVWVNAVLTRQDFALALGLFAALAFWKTPPWMVVLAGAFAGWIVYG